MDLEIIIAVLIFLFSLAIIVLDKKFALYVLLLLSVLLHKELFSIYRWNLLPIRIFMFAFFVWAVYVFTDQFLRKRDFRAVFGTLKRPFVGLLSLLWFVRALSLIFTRNLFTSLTLFGFFTTVSALGIFLYIKYKDSPAQTLKFIRFYIFVLFGLCVFAYLQAFLYLRYEIIIGALWNVPGKFPRLGSLFWDVNHFGGLLAALLPVLGVFILITKEVKRRILYVFMFLSMSGVLLFTNSRTSWILAFVAFAVFCSIWLFKKFGLKGIFVAGLIMLLFSSVLFAEYMDKSSPFRKKIKDYFHYRIDSFDSHIMLLQGSWQVFEEYPYLGGGYGGFFEHFAKTDIAAGYFGRDPAALNTRVPAHTVWGEALAETGAIGAAVWGLFVLLVLGTLLYLALNSAQVKDALLSSAMFSSILGWLVAGVFYSYNSEFFFIVIFFYFIFAVGVLGEDYDWNKILGFFSRIKQVPFVVALLIAGVLIFAGLGHNHLIPWDEAIYAEIAQNMLKSGEFLAQQWRRGAYWFEKPPFYMWRMALCMNLLGVSAFSARLPSALAGFATVGVVYLFAKRLFDRRTAYVSSLALTTTVHFLYYSRASMLDVSAAFFITLCLVLYYVAKERETKHEHSRLPLFVLWIFSGVSLGFAVMTKGVIGLLPVPIIGLYEVYLLLTSQQKVSVQLVRRLLLLAGVALLIFLPWHIYSYVRFGPKFLQTYIGYHVIARGLSAIEDKGRPFWWYWVVLKVSLRIWFVVLIPAFFFGAFKALKKDNRFAFLLIWFVFILAFFSAAESKLVWYIIPLYPVAVILVGRFLVYVLDLVLKNLPTLDTYLTRFLFYFGLTFFSLFYLFLNRELVYTSDLTGSQAKLLQLKDEEFGEETKVYADRIELPLVLFYSDGPFEIVDFGPLKRKLANAALGERIVFITKESRFRAFKEIHPTLELEKRINEWVLGYLPAKEVVSEASVSSPEKMK